MFREPPGSPDQRRTWVRIDRNHPSGHVSFASEICRQPAGARARAWLSRTKPPNALVDALSALGIKHVEMPATPEVL
jgi:hypothetical protein